MRSPCAVCHCCRFLGTSLIPQLTLDLAGCHTQRTCRARPVHACSPSRGQDPRGLQRTIRATGENSICVACHGSLRAAARRGMAAAFAPLRATGTCTAEAQGRSPLLCKGAGRRSEALAGGSMATRDEAGNGRFSERRARARSAIRTQASDALHALWLSCLRDGRKTAAGRSKNVQLRGLVHAVISGAAPQNRPRHAIRLTRSRAASPPIGGELARRGCNPCANGS